MTAAEWRAYRKKLDSANRKSRRDKRLAAGLCVRCGKRPHVPGKQMCEECNAHVAAQARRRYAEKKKESGEKVLEPVHCNPPEDCFSCPYAECRAGNRPTTQGEKAFLEAGNPKHDATVHSHFAVYEQGGQIDKKIAAVLTATKTKLTRL